MVRNIFKIFSRSPFEPLTEHLKKCVETAKKVPDLMAAFKKGDHVTTKEIAKQIMVLEHDADIIKTEIRDHLPKTLFLPVDRRDLLRILSAQDDIADQVEDLAVVITIKEGLPIPTQMIEELDRVCGLVMECVQGALIIGNEIGELLESGFGGPEAERVFGLIKDVGEMEHKADKRQYKLSQLLMQFEDQMKPSDLILWIEVIKNLGKIANAAEGYTKELRNVLAR